MKLLFGLGAIIGLGGVLAAAHFYPWVSHARLPSQTSVVANGGRAEQFVIRLPADRIGAASSDRDAVRGASDIFLPAKLIESPLLVEHFKIRDVEGNVIGLAARHWTATSDASATAWSIVIPSRGALLLVAPGESRGALDAALRRAGYAPGAAWNGDVRVDVLADDGAGRLLAGTEEFERLWGRYSETWTVNGVTATGEIHGTIALGTVTHQGS